MGLTDLGFHRRSYDEILSDKIARAEELFGSDIETGEQTPLGKFIRIGAYDQALAEEEIEDLYYSIFPDTATGVSLDHLCTFVGIKRTPAISSRYQVCLHGQAGTQIPYGFLVETPAKVRFYNTAEIQLDGNGDGAITADCETPGVIGNVAAAEINTVVNPVAGLVVVSSGNTIIRYGEETESDASLRTRFSLAGAGAGSCSPNAIRAALMRIPTVTGVSVIVNESDDDIIDETDLTTFPAHSFECCISGGELVYYDQIAQTIFDKKPIGIATRGDLSRTVTDEAGIEHLIYFSKAAEISVDLNIELQTDPNYTGVNDKVREALRSHIDSLPIGADVVISALYAVIHSVSGVVEVKLLNLRETSGTAWHSRTITLSPKQKAKTDEITITEVSG